LVFKHVCPIILIVSKALSTFFLSYNLFSSSFKKIEFVYLNFHLVILHKMTIIDVSKLSYLLLFKYKYFLYDF